MTELTNLWGLLRTHGEGDQGYVRLRLTSTTVCAVYAARQLPSDLDALILEVSTESIPPNPDYPRSVGFDVEAEPIAPGRHGRTRLVLVLTNARFQDVFQSLCEDVVQSIGSARNEGEAVSAFVARLSRWQAFLRKHGPGGLSIEARRGLYGELTFLRELLTRTADGSAIGAWKGWSHTNHDFQLPTGNVEVKTTSANTPHSFHISNIGQLDDRSIPRLFLNFVVVDENEAGAESLPELVESIRLRVSDDWADQFDESLVQAGYLETHRDQYATPRYNIRSTRFYRVEDGFPRLRAEDLALGVEQVTYSVAVAACRDFLQYESQVFLELLPGADWPST
ncbi:MAG TPA: PD-(D/E)XK motif protein [Gemmatimonadaceae bacterium]|nr:PD-(D/E)XK motif protein [Gemmatimonadaceae bacterium]